MPNDVPDWTGLNQVNLVGGLSGAPLGDVAAPTLQADSVTQSIVSGGGSPQGLIDLCSFKPAAGSSIALVALGTFAKGTPSSVSPTFKQATVAGHLLVAWVTCTGTTPTTAAAGWSEVGTAPQGGIWVKPNCGNGEAAPVFTASGATGPICAQLAEFSGAATSSPLDQTAVNNVAPAATITATNPAPDATIGDLIVTCAIWSVSPDSPATFVTTYNNAAVVHAGDSGGTVQHGIASFDFGIIPPAPVAQPLGVAPWPLDVDGFNAPAVAAQATVTLAATPGKAYTITAFSMSIQAGATAPGQLYAEIDDGANAVYKENVTGSAASTTYAIKNPPGYSRKMTAGNSVTCKFGTGVTAASETVYVGGYLR